MGLLKCKALPCCWRASAPQKRLFLGPGTREEEVLRLENRTRRWEYGWGRPRILSNVQGCIVTKFSEGKRYLDVLIKVRFLIPACSQQKQEIPMTTLEETLILTWRGRMFQKTLPGVQDVRGMLATGRGMRRRLPPTGASANRTRYHSNSSQR